MLFLINNLYKNIINPKITFRLQPNRKHVYSLSLSSKEDLNKSVNLIAQTGGLKGYKLY